MGHATLRRDSHPFQRPGGMAARSGSDTRGCGFGTAVRLPSTGRLLLPLLGFHWLRRIARLVPPAGIAPHCRRLLLLHSAALLCALQHLVAHGVARENCKRQHREVGRHSAPAGEERAGRRRHHCPPAGGGNLRLQCEQCQLQRQRLRHIWCRLGVGAGLRLPRCSDRRSCRSSFGGASSGATTLGLGALRDWRDHDNSDRRRVRCRGRCLRRFIECGLALHPPWAQATLCVMLTPWARERT
mmetsp:Transcript_87446/g.187587  ORF Transcript_87446/g.187587 Transcript_87446/m.187587 type:complete len:242 (+) Transcript_87446:1100-1825(+)